MDLNTNFFSKIDIFLYFFEFLFLILSILLILGLAPLFLGFVALDSGIQELLIEFSVLNRQVGYINALIDEQACIFEILIEIRVVKFIIRTEKRKFLKQTSKIMFDWGSLDTDNFILFLRRVIEAMTLF